MLSKKLGAIFDGHDGVTFGLAVASVMFLPFALAEGRMIHGHPLEIGGALLVALLNAAVPMVLEFRALQRMSARTYGVLVTLEPAIGALVGALFLGQAIGLSMSAAIACVTIAALGITLLDRQGRPMSLAEPAAPGAPPAALCRGVHGLRRLQPDDHRLHPHAADAATGHAAAGHLRPRSAPSRSACCSASIRWASSSARRSWARSPIASAAGRSCWSRSGHHRLLCGDQLGHLRPDSLPL